MPLVNASDLYGGDGARRLTGTRPETGAVAASGSVGNTASNSPNTNSSFSWVAFVFILLFIRVLEEFAPTR